MATKYQIINVKASKGVIEGNPFDNRMILCYSSEPGKYLICGPNTENLKMKTDDFNYTVRAHGYEVNELEGKIMLPTFGRNDYITDFILSDPDTGGDREVIAVLQVLAIIAAIFLVMSIIIWIISKFRK